MKGNNLAPSGESCNSPGKSVETRARRTPFCQHMVHHLAVSDIDKSEVNWVQTTCAATKFHKESTNFQHVDMLWFLPAIPENSLPVPHEAWVWHHQGLRTIFLGCQDFDLTPSVETCRIMILFKCSISFPSTMPGSKVIVWDITLWATPSLCIPVCLAPRQQHYAI